MTIEITAEAVSHGGRQLVVKHASVVTNTDMIFDRHHRGW